MTAKVIQTQWPGQQDGSAGIGLNPVASRVLDLRRGRHLTRDPRGHERPDQTEPGRTSFVDHRRRLGQ
jgi:hypothetical protein